MQNAAQLIQNLRRDKFKITKARATILELFSKSSSPLAASDLISAFANLNLASDNGKPFSPNKTTIYRELEFLLANGYIREVEFGEGKKRYELESDSHHHHLICLRCKKVLDVQLRIDLKKEENRLERKNKFKIRNHNLEFFGYCSTCQS